MELRLKAIVQDKFGSPGEVLEFKEVPKPVVKNDQVPPTSGNMGEHMCFSYVKRPARVGLFGRLGGGSGRRRWRVFV
jgi:hypothetical protein